MFLAIPSRTSLYWWRSKLYALAEPRCLCNLILLPIKKNSAKTLLKVLLQSSNNLVQDVGLGAACLSSWLFVLEIVIENKVDGLSGGKWDKLEILRDILPVVNEDCLDVVGDDQLD